MFFQFPSEEHVIGLGNITYHSLVVQPKSPGPVQLLVIIMSPLSLLIVISSFRAYVMLLAKGTLPSLILSGVSRQVSSMLSD